MRRRIRLTGRKQLRKSAFNVKFADLPGKRLVTMTVADQSAFKEFPLDAKVSVRLQENKRIEVLDFGTIGGSKGAVETRLGFVAPTCQVRVTSIGPQRKSLLLGSTDGWTIRGLDDDTEEGRQSILLFLPAETAPRSWKLDIRESDYPVVYVDKRIPDARNWAKADPVFQATVLPAVIGQVFEAILSRPATSDVEWVQQWARWAEALMPSRALPFGAEMMERRDFVDALLDTFCMRHDLADGLLKSVVEKRTKV
jgi:hypothetical protein